MTTISDQINEEIKAGEISEYNETQAALNELKSTYGTEVPDVETKEGYDRAKKIASKCRAIRTALEDKRKIIKAPAIAFGKLIDSKAKELKEEIESIEQPFLNAYRAEDEKKKMLKLEAEQRLIDIKALPQSCFDKTPEQIEEIIDKLSCVSIDYSTFRHKLTEAETVVSGTLRELSLEHNKSIERKLEADRVEAERIELEELRRQAAEREQQEQERLAEQARIERENELKKQAEIEAKQKAEREIEQAKQAAIDAENKAKRDAEQAEKDRIEAAKKAEQEKQQAIEAERQRQAQEQARKEAEARAREEDKAHRAKINNAALQCFVNGGLTEEQAKLAVTLIASKQVDNITINY